MSPIPMGYIETYNDTHQNKINRALHTVGIPMIVISLPLFFFYWKWALGLFVVGWILQFIGHAFEGKPPAFFSHPMYLFTGVYWWGVKALGLKKAQKKDS